LVTVVPLARPMMPSTESMVPALKMLEAALIARTPYVLA
jgi:hypothetical protein